MARYLSVGGFRVPTYFLMVALGVFFANVIALVVIRVKKLPHPGVQFKRLAFSEAFGGVGAIFGAKLYAWIQHAIAVGDVSALSFDMLSRAGHSFMGGLLMGLLFIKMGSYVRRTDVVLQERYFLNMIPFVHFFWKIGCFLAGCCHGIPWNGPFSVTFPEGADGIANVPLFPVQLLEAAELLVIMAVLGTEAQKGKKHLTSLYLLLYCSMRFAAEFFRYQSSTAVFVESQAVFFLIAAASLVYRLNLVKREMKHE